MCRLHLDIFLSSISQHVRFCTTISIYLVCHPIRHKNLTIARLVFLQSALPNRYNEINAPCGSANTGLSRGPPTNLTFSIAIGIQNGMQPTCRLQWKSIPPDPMLRVNERTHEVRRNNKSPRLPGASYVNTLKAGARHPQD